MQTLKVAKDLCVKMRLIFFGRIKTTKIIVCKMGIRLFYADFKKYKRFYVNELRFFFGELKLLNNCLKMRVRLFYADLKLQKIHV